jgi:hypothetical protein
MNIWKEVSQKDFKIFINSYPNKLTTNTCFMCEPPRLEFYDFSIKNEANGETIKAYLYDDYLDNDKRHYFVKGV